MYNGLDCDSERFNYTDASLTYVYLDRGGESEAEISDVALVFGFSHFPIGQLTSQPTTREIFLYQPSISIVSIVPRISMVHPWIVVMLGRVGRILRLRAGCSYARRFRVVTARAAGPEWFGAVVKVIRCGSLHYQVENRGASHHLDGSLEWKIGEPLTVAPNYNVAGF